MELVCKGAVSKLSELLDSVTIRLQGLDEDADVPGTDVLHAAQSLEVSATEDGLSAVRHIIFYTLFTFLGSRVPHQLLLPQVAPGVRIPANSERGDSDLVQHIVLHREVGGRGEIL